MQLQFFCVIDCVTCGVERERHRAGRRAPKWEK